MLIDIVSSDGLMVRTLREFVGHLGHTVAHDDAGNRPPAPTAAIAGDADVVIADMRHADSTLRRVLRELHNRVPTLPVVAIVSNASLPPVDEAVAAGIHAFLHQPIRLSELELVLIRLAERGA